MFALGSKPLQTCTWMDVIGQQIASPDDVQHFAGLHVTADWLD